MSTKRVLYNFKPYSKPKKALYYQTGHEYIKDSTTGILGWSRIPVETIVIGENDTCYIEKLMEHECCNTDEPDYGEIVLLPHGFHKSRLLRWIDLPGEQLSLF
jgi:hypothetical protein